jgi:hypothetical protein
MYLFFLVYWRMKDGNTMKDPILMSPGGSDLPESD